jgi:N-acyl-D-amino-acid deacylase
MKRLVAQAMDEGAWGLSSGLIYPPSAYASTDELVELSCVPAARAGFYFTHIRGEAETLLQAVAEAIEIGERCGLPVQIAHFKAMDPENWSLLPQALSLIDDARARGVDVAADRYPYIASSTSLSASLPTWAHDGGPKALLARLEQSAERKRILADPYTRSRRWDKTVIAQCRDNAQWEGLSVAEIAAQHGTDPAETVLDMLLEAEGRISVIYYGMDEDNLRTVLRHPAMMIGSDGSARPTGRSGKARRIRGTMARFPACWPSMRDRRGCCPCPRPFTR